MSGLLGVIIFAGSLLASIALHELGHLVPAKKFGVRVSQYMVGFGPTLWSRVRGETQYGIKAIPLGGYIRIVGMFPPRKTPVDPDADGMFNTMIEGSRAQSLLEVVEGEEDRVFYNLSAPKKIVVMFGGPFMNFLIACILFTIACAGIGTSNPTTAVAKVVACVPTTDNPTGIVSTDGTCSGGTYSAAQVAKLSVGDKLVSINSKPLNQWSDLADAVQQLGGKSVVLTYLRAGVSHSTTVVLPAREVPVYDASGADTGKTKTVGFVGVSPKFEATPVALGAMPGFIWQQLKDTGSAILSFPKAAFTMGQTLTTSKPREANGPVSVVGIGQISDQIASDTNASTSDKAYAFLMMIASLNLFLFVFNLVPILPLDGGHIAGAIYEGVRRQIARVRRKPLPGPVDAARMMPLAYVMAILLIGVSIISILTDVIKPIAF